MKNPASLGHPVAEPLRGKTRRRSQRVMIRIPVTLRLTTAAQEVILQVTTAWVNDHGAMLQCSRMLAPDTTLEIQNERTCEKQLCRVTRTPIESRDGYLIPVEFAAPTPGFWHISFPPTN